MAAQPGAAQTLRLAARGIYRYVSSMDTRRAAQELIGELELPPLKHSLKVAACALLALIVSWWFDGAEGLSLAGNRALFILVLAASLWVTEAIPAFAVGMLIIGLQVALLGLPASGLATQPTDWEQYARVLGHPLIWLFFGGFVLARAARKSQLDRLLAVFVLMRTGSRYRNVLFGVMLITFVFSMFMSNTATAAMMVALLTPIIQSNQDRSATGLLLGVAAAANLGGMATLIGTPPNAIAVGGLSGLPEQHIGFVSWMVLGLPLGVVLAALVWAFLSKRYSPQSAAVDFELPAASRRQVARWEQLMVALTFFATLGLWMTGPYHEIPTAAISFVPIVVLTMTSILDRKDIAEFPWDVLFLLAGGLALGLSAKNTGLADWMVSGIRLEGSGIVVLALVLSYVCAALSNFMSNTAAANVLVPIGVTMAAGAESSVAVPLALAASSAMCLPIATPPNALVFATNRVSSKDFVVLGGVLVLLTPALAVLWTSVSLPWVLR